MGVPTWSFGVIINIIGSVSINFGTNLMKFAHSEKDRQLLEMELSRHDGHVAGGDQGTRPQVRHLTLREGKEREREIDR